MARAVSTGSPLAIQGLMEYCTVKWSGGHIRYARGWGSLDGRAAAGAAVYVSVIEPPLGRPGDQALSVRAARRGRNAHDLRVRRDSLRSSGKGRGNVAC